MQGAVNAGFEVSAFVRSKVQFDENDFISALQQCFMRGKRGIMNG